MINRTKLLLAILVVLVVALCVGARVYSSKQTLVIAYQNVTSVTVQPAGALEDPAKQQVKVLAYSPSGKSIRLKKGVYIINYVGSAGYASGQQTITLSSTKQAVQIKPDYSKQHLANLLSQQIKQIHGLLTKKYPAMKQYSYAQEYLISYGNWYVAKLQYVGKDIYNADDLRVVLRKNGTSWTIATDPPSIWLSTGKYPDVPEWVLAQANQL